MRIDRDLLLACAGHLVKLAAEFKPVVSSNLAEIKKHLQPGDIINTSVRKEHVKGLDRIFLRLSRAYQGSQYTHSALYVGDGKIVNMGTSPRGEFTGPETPLKQIPLEALTKKYEFKVLRPINATPTEKKDAVEWMKKQVNKTYPSAWKIVRMGLLAPKKAKRRLRLMPAKSACSEMIANAYHQQEFGKGKASQSVLPADFERSPLTRTVAVFKVGS